MYDVSNISKEKFTSSTLHPNTEGSRYLKDKNKQCVKNNKNVTSDI